MKNVKKTAQLNKNKVKDIHAKFTEKLKRKAENDPVERPKAKSKRTDSRPVWYFYTVFLKKGEQYGRCKCGKHESKLIDGSTSNLLRHLRVSHETEFDAKLNVLKEQSKKTKKMTNYYGKLHSWKPDSPHVVFE